MLVMYSLWFTLYSVHSSFYFFTLHYTIYTVQCALQTVQFTLYSLYCRYNMNNIHCTLYTVQSTLSTVHCRVYSVHCTQYTVYYTVSTVQCNNAHFTVYTYTLQCTVYCTVYCAQCRGQRVPGVCLWHLVGWTLEWPGHESLGFSHKNIKIGAVSIVKLEPARAPIILAPLQFEWSHADKIGAPN